jgi:hypothetical protein
LTSRTAATAPLVVIRTASRVFKVRHQRLAPLSTCLCLWMQNWDGTGGNGSALRHFEVTGRKYPLAVKLGTITPRGADVFS